RLRPTSPFGRSQRPSLKMNSTRSVGSITSPPDASTRLSLSIVGGADRLEQLVLPVVQIVEGHALDGEGEALAALLLLHGLEGLAVVVLDGAHDVQHRLEAAVELVVGVDDHPGALGRGRAPEHLLFAACEAVPALADLLIVLLVLPVLQGILETRAEADQLRRLADREVELYQYQAAVYLLLLPLQHLAHEVLVLGARAVAHR